jgi:hypothetical protein
LLWLVAVSREKLLPAMWNYCSQAFDKGMAGAVYGPWRILWVFHPDTIKPILNSQSPVVMEKVRVAPG